MWLVNKCDHVIMSLYMLQVTPRSGNTTTGDMYQAMQQRMAHFSRPGSAYVINIDSIGGSQGNKVQYVYSR